ncbi:hypothetical protein [uncultured Lacinutrix sp.]|uniref:FKBP-type peptidyl-prolyl cis-trans isomerase n=1 Tax=uncultured Lacinutrix sp. TaxID=574032 RepID=UPI00260FA316|nr:hypothetical protein [uncultured Lacinutrix sp.]
MNLRKFLIPTLSLFFVVFSCTDEEDDIVPIATRERQEVYDENEEDILTYFETHFFNYEDFDFADANNPANNEFTIVLDTISIGNGTSDKTPIINYLNQAEGVFPRLDIKIVNQDDIDYNLYILKIRAGEGDNISPLDAAAMIYTGLTPDGTIFDSQVNIGLGQPFDLSGVVAGFREGIVEFKTSTGFTENADGSITYNNHGIGAVFMQSGLGYFADPPSSIDQYVPLFFKLNVISRSNTDYDGDGIPSHLEHPDGDTTDDDEDDTDEDSFANYIDNDDDGDGVLTADEIEQKEYEDDGTNQFMSKAEAQAYFTANAATDEIFISIEAEQDGTYILHTVVVPATMVNGVSIPNYLNSDITTELE